MVRQVQAASTIVCIRTRTYRERFEGEARAGGLGVSREGQLLTTELCLKLARRPGRPNTSRTCHWSSSASTRSSGRSTLPAILPRLGLTAGRPRPVPTPTISGDAPLSALDPTFKPPRRARGMAEDLPSQLSRPEHAVVPFIGRTAAVGELDRWCAGGGVGVRLVIGGGSAGKTRLALHSALHLALYPVDRRWAERPKLGAAIPWAPRPSAGGCRPRSALTGLGLRGPRLRRVPCGVRPAAALPSPWRTDPWGPEFRDFELMPPCFSLFGDLSAGASQKPAFARWPIVGSGLNAKFRMAWVRRGEIFGGMSPA